MFNKKQVIVILVSLLTTLYSVQAQPPPDENEFCYSYKKKIMRQGRPTRPGNQWGTDCNSGLPDSGFTLVAIYSKTTQTVFNKMTFGKCIESDVKLSRNSVRISTLVKDPNKVVPCPNGHVVTAIFSPGKPVPNVNQMQCTKLAESHWMDDMDCSTLPLHNGNYVNGPKEIIEKWNAECDYKNGYLLAGLGNYKDKLDNYLSVMKCCKVKPKCPYGDSGRFEGLCMKRLARHVGAPNGPSSPELIWNTDCFPGVLTSIYMYTPDENSPFTNINMVKCIDTSAVDNTASPVVTDTIIDPALEDPVAPDPCPPHHVITAIFANGDYSNVVLVKCRKLHPMYTINYNDCHSFNPSRQRFWGGARTAEEKWNVGCHFERGFLMVGFGMKPDGGTGNGNRYTYVNCCRVNKNVLPVFDGPILISK